MAHNPNRQEITPTPYTAQEFAQDIRIMNEHRGGETQDDFGNILFLTLGDQVFEITVKEHKQ